METSYKIIFGLLVLVIILAIVSGANNMKKCCEITLRDISQNFSETYFDNNYIVLGEPVDTILDDNTNGLICNLLNDKTDYYWHPIFTQALKQFNYCTYLLKYTFNKKMDISQLVLKFPNISTDYFADNLSLVLYRKNAEKQTMVINKTVEPLLKQNSDVQTFNLSFSTTTLPLTMDIGDFIIVQVNGSNAIKPTPLCIQNLYFK